MNFAAQRSWSKRNKLIARGKRQNKTQKQSYEKEHNKQIRFHQAVINLMTKIPFYSTFTRHPYQKETNYIKLMAETHAVHALELIL